MKSFHPGLLPTRFVNVSAALLEGIASLLLAATACGQAVTFAPPQSFPTGQFPTRAVAGDFNKDGKIDVAVVNQNSNNISILLGKGDGTVQPGATVPLPSSPTSIVIGDANNDGNLDLLVVSIPNSTMSVLLGRGDGTFQNPLTTPTPQLFPQSIAAGDFNADAKLDLAVAAAGRVFILMGKGDGTFSDGGNYPAGLAPSAIQAIDVNGDGRLDLVVEDPIGNTLAVLLGTSDGKFSPLPPQIGPHLANPGAALLLALDLNGDQHPDLVTGNTGLTSLSIALGKGDGTFSPAASVGLESGGVSIVAGDFNGDGKADLAVAYNTGSSFSVFAGNGDGTFQPAQKFAGPSQPSFVLAADMDRDGRNDLIMVEAFASTATVLRNTTGLAPSGPPAISLSNSRLQFTLENGGVLLPQSVTIANSGRGTLAWTATSNAPWLLISSQPPPPNPPPSPLQTSGTAPSTLTVSVNPTGLAPGSYGGVILVTAAGAANSPQGILVSMTLPGPTGPPPQPYVRSVQNSASYAYKVAQGSIFVVTGANLGPPQLVQASSNSLPVQLEGTIVQVTIGGSIFLCPIAYTSFGQIAAILPSNTPTGQGILTVSYIGQTSGPNPIRVVSTGVGIYSVASSGIGTGIITGTDYVTKSMARPAKPGEILIAWGTGLGPIGGNDAVVAPSPPFSSVEVFVGNQGATVIGAGRSGCCAGLDQIAFEVPQATPLGCFVPVSIRSAGSATGTVGSLSNFVTLPLSQSGEPCSNPAPGFPAALVSKAATGAPVSIAVLAIGTGPLFGDIAPLRSANLQAARRLAAQLSATMHVTVPESDIVRLWKAYQSGDPTAVRRILVRYGRALKHNPAAARLLRSAADLAGQQEAVAAFALGSAIGLVGPEYASDFPATGTCTILQNFPADHSARLSLFDAGSALSLDGPSGHKTMAQVSAGQYSVALGSPNSSPNTPPGLYTVSGTGGKNVGPFSVSLNVGNPVTWTNKSATSVIDRTNPVTLTWSGGSASGHVLIGAVVKASTAATISPDSSGALLLCSESTQKGTFTIPQFVLSALSAQQNATLFIAPHPLDNPVTIQGLDLAYIADGSSDSRTVTIQ